MVQCRAFALDYRWAPEHPFPSAVDDAAAGFLWLVKSGVAPANIALAGDSAGGGLVIATMLRLRAQGHALPGCAICLSPWVDLTGACKYRNAGSCSMFQPDDIAVFGGLYLQGASPESPEASPVFADLRGLPPLLIQVSNKELLLDDAVRLHRKAISCGVKSTLSVFPELPHVWQILFGLIPEAGAALHEIANFIRASFGVSEIPATNPVMSESKTAVSAIEKIPK
jgi:acetyl esterase/lipase